MRALSTIMFVIVLYAAMISIGVTVNRSHVVPSVNPDVRVQWRSFRVGGMLLVNGARADSLGDAPAIRLPRGSILQVPAPVADSLFWWEQRKFST